MVENKKICKIRKKKKVSASKTMGTVTSDLTYNIKAQAEALSDGPPIYKLIGVAGEGELVRLIKIAVKTRNFNEVDRLIKTTVVKFLYNEGRGENVYTATLRESFKLYYNIKMFFSILLQ